MVPVFYSSPVPALPLEIAQEWRLYRQSEMHTLVEEGKRQPAGPASPSLR